MERPSELLSSLAFRMDLVEKDLGKLGDQLSAYVLARENDLKLQGIQDTVRRIEGNIAVSNQQIANVGEKLTALEIDQQRRDADARDSQNKLVIRVLLAIGTAIVTVVGGVLIALFTHILH